MNFALSSLSHSLTHAHFSLSLSLSLCFLSSLSPTSVGGSLPVIFPYIAEFTLNKYRGTYMSLQSFFWTAGRLVCAGVAWLILPLDTGAFHSWRLYIFLSSLPAFCGALLYLLLPESPRYLLEVCLYRYIYMYIYCCEYGRTLPQLVIATPYSHPFRTPFSVAWEEGEGSEEPETGAHHQPFPQGEVSLPHQEHPRGCRPC